MITDETPVVEAKTKKRITSTIPIADQNLSDCSNKVSETWLLNPGVTMMWTDSAAFRNTTNLYRKSLGDRQTKGGGRAVVTRDLRVLDKDINQKKAYIVVYLKDKYDQDTYTSYLPQFGIVKQYHRWIFPADRNNRLASLKLTVKAITAQGFDNNKYGLAYWQDIATRYEAALNLSISTDGEVSKLVSAKNEYRKQIQKTLNALIHNIKSNYPETYAAVLRGWGFQKEKY